MMTAATRTGLAYSPNCVEICAIGFVLAVACANESDPNDADDPA